MALKVSGRLVVVRQDDDDNEVRIEVSAESFEIDEPEVHDADRQMGSEIVYRVSATHDELGEVVWNVYEYPSGVMNHVEAPSIDGSVLEEPSFLIMLD
ncbi:hypothetical protein [Sphingobium yanoikuyae]|uniref:hypothetical protein n=1 Tax=Sphingobium yanoikuyae TaxID=13690 RepID=UPI0028B137C1|nr:hypothetical protein [Sphingobium yanoikuyae]